ncbi:hypothetical protein F511_39218 [Dorcoceras hygrometricum]|uniref:Phthiocerol/phthiodiolone dimycocerosyl transferase C-terminal domain-containing protein n=1 Tax=Dorcoceras hygrometricum TaxID=472368 RepID=A0A2Z7CI46_9LAMI|nr:hypothetical protein F511_39218 [Dorcoceras hygrometricum]
MTSLSPQPAKAAEPKTRPVGDTELSWCKAVPGGTGITVLALLLSKPPDISFLQNALRKLQISHPILNSKLRRDPASCSFSYVIHPAPYIDIHQFDVQSTSHILESHETTAPLPPLHLILEHELNKNSWEEGTGAPSDADIFFASVYALVDTTWVLALRLHTSACDRTSAVALLRDLMEELKGVDGVAERGMQKEMGTSLGIEEYIPAGQANKPFWAHGVDVLGYSLNSFRFSNLNFKDTLSPRVSRVVRLQLNAEETGRLISGCKRSEIKLFGLLTAAGMIASRSIKGIPHDQWEKYAVVTLTDCRSILDPVLSSNHIGFYHSALLNTHDVKGGENVWELAKRICKAFTNAKNNWKHFTDMADINFLMCKAIENPGLTPSGSLRTSLISIFEDHVIERSSKISQEMGLEDFIGCASVHGVGPSIAIFDTIRDGKLDCACVYPYPLHSREQMQELVDKMKRIILDVGI